VARTGENRNPYRTLVGKEIIKKNTLEDLDVDVTIEFKRIIKK
jgi:hypothetical protein